MSVGRNSAKISSTKELSKNLRRNDYLTTASTFTTSFMTGIALGASQSHYQRIQRKILIEAGETHYLRTTENTLSGHVLGPDLALLIDHPGAVIASTMESPMFLVIQTRTRTQTRKILMRFGKSMQTNPDLAS